MSQRRIVVRPRTNEHRETEPTPGRTHLADQFRSVRAVLQIDDQVVDFRAGADFDQVGPQVIGRQDADDDVAATHLLHQFTSGLHALLRISVPPTLDHVPASAASNNFVTGR